jgi:hypothetical protein
MSFYSDTEEFFEMEMFEKSFERPRNFFELSTQEQWNIDKKLGILDWQGEFLDGADVARFKAHYTSL